MLVPDRKSDFRTKTEKSLLLFLIRSHLPAPRTTFCRTNRCRAIFFFLQLPSELSGSFRLPTRGYFRSLICISANRLLSYCLKRSNDHDTFSRGETGRKINSETDVAVDLSLDLLIRIINDASIPLFNNPVLNCYFLILLIQKMKA